MLNNWLRPALFGSSPGAHGFCTKKTWLHFLQDKLKFDGLFEVFWHYRSVKYAVRGFKVGLGKTEANQAKPRLEALETRI